MLGKRKDHKGFFVVFVFFVAFVPGRKPWPLRLQPVSLLVAIVLRLVGPFNRHADVGGLFLRELRQLHAQMIEV